MWLRECEYFFAMVNDKKRGDIQPKKISVPIKSAQNSQKSAKTNGMYVTSINENDRRNFLW